MDPTMCGTTVTYFGVATVLECLGKRYFASALIYALVGLYYMMWMFICLKKV